LLLVALLAGAGGTEASIPRPEASAELAGWPPALPDAPALVDLNLAPAPAIVPLATTTTPPAAAAAGDRFGLFDPGPGAGLFVAGHASARARLEAETRLRVHDLELPVGIELEPLEVAERTGFTLFGGRETRRGSENRYFDPELGRFTSTDPMGYFDGPNLYQYGFNNPVMYGDPMGLYSLRQFGRDAMFWDDVVFGTYANLQDPRNTWKNAQRGAGGLVGTVKMLGTTALDLALLVADNGSLIPPPGAKERNAQRMDALVQFAEDPIGTVVEEHRRALAQLEAHEARGEYFKGGIVTGELASGDALVVLGAVEGGIGLARGLTRGMARGTGRLRAAVSFGDDIDVALQGAFRELAAESRVPATTIPRGAGPARGWRVGDPITNLTARGKVPAWSTVRARYWRNEAFNNPSAYRARDLTRMQRGSAPQRLNPVTGTLESMELHHAPPMRQGGLFDVTPVWPSEHAAIDPFRHLGN